MRIQYQDLNLRAATLDRIEKANEIIDEYRAQGYILTLRQLYYQFVARDLLANTQRNYNVLGKAISNGRLAGLIDWEAIEDRTRSLRALAHWESEASIVEACASQFRIDLWGTQKNRVEVWVEKEALVGVFERVCNRFDVPFFACRGYVSQSEQWAAGRRFKMYIDSGQHPIVLHFGDHDPSGIDMTRDNRDRLLMFAEHRVEVRRLALNAEQVEEYNPPPNPAKVTDSRFEGYAAVHGEESWELDALQPDVLAGLVEGEVSSLIDDNAWIEANARQDEGRARLREIADELRDD